MLIVPSFERLRLCITCYEVNLLNSTDWNASDLILIEAHFSSQVINDVITNIVISTLIPIHIWCIEFVNSHDNLVDSNCFGKNRVWLGRAIGLHTLFICSYACVQHENSSIGLASSLNHIGNEVLVARRVKHNYVFELCLEKAFSHIDCNTASPLFFVLIHHVSELKSWLAIKLRQF